ncbi:MAG TPA: M23 family metallopeptidase [Candidatus Dormibacteraeota bacterium]|nr:M23 family metallopeptidase [Candidatus Dormibacteraeota bacterium]
MIDSRVGLAALACAVLMLIPGGPGGSAGQVSAPASARVAAVPSSDIFQYPLPTWTPHCLGFGSQWRYCNGTPLRSCAGAVWLHTGVDITTGIQPVRAAADGVIAGYIIDPTFRGVLIRHRTSSGIVLTQYWHVWLRPGFKVGTPVKRGEMFADVADMGDKTHLHFAVFIGDYDSHAWQGALPPSACSGFPAFPYRFVDPNAFLEAHQLVVPMPRGTRL